MNSQNLFLAGSFVSKNYIELASNALNSRQNLIKVLLSQRCIPEEGWDDLSIEHFLQELAMMDTNNFSNKIGIGEREGRVFSNLVNKRHYFMSHGIGRSGDIRAEQPKAAGSSLILKLTECLVKDTLKTCGYQGISHVLLLPLATGMSLSLALSALKVQAMTPDKEDIKQIEEGQIKGESKEKEVNEESKEDEKQINSSLNLIKESVQIKQRKYVIWPRIDQKTCLKCIFTSGLDVIVIENKIVGDSLQTDLEAIEEAMKQRGDEILCVLSTTSCFAPRIPDDIEGIAILCKKYGIGHVINNAYGMQCSKIANSVNLAQKRGRVDCLVSSTDKNLMVPVGGAFVYSSHKKTIHAINDLYPGRASAGPILDVFITLLSMGKNHLKHLLNQRKENFNYMKVKLQEFAARQGERVLETKGNSISIALSLESVQRFILSQPTENQKEITSLGSLLYTKRVMGSRILSDNSKKVCGINFLNYGSHSDKYPFLPYLTAACAIGMSKQEIDAFIEKLEETFKILKSNKN